MWEIIFCDDNSKSEFYELPPHLLARGLMVLDIIKLKGNNTKGTITKFLRDGIFEIRIMASKDIARSLYAYEIGKKIIILTSFVKKTQKAPNDKIELALKRLKEWKDENRD
ncbi:type II toxin-antitoxin system RelE/ParE family toxin [Campylobacter sp. JMF_01 NE2]|uniref:type II toxin-antitoxin system RelE/ParE family toxin n=1 Tax=unclassified Campylobacter TaxID=2593542 RepID=UPI0022EA076D|nr:MULTISPECIES: type II toxin-antitoxin system RelE/ParE family toxin [unclassified Campylobacter]MDA3052565.1 type II toxin-antitoxin system RelE/ParE family toxin [Campylobacter sp. JMF_03 NE3]MDA3066897.1 type II toxin-antitoxin system RelE/ParE family toxin [Campylobacter sp. JMF_01 NE2]